MKAIALAYYLLMGTPDGNMWIMDGPISWDDCRAAMEAAPLTDYSCYSSAELGLPATKEL